MWIWLLHLMNGKCIWLLHQSLLAFSKSSFVAYIKCCKQNLPPSFVTDTSYMCAGPTSNVANGNFCLKHHMCAVRKVARSFFCNVWCRCQSFFSWEICSYSIVLRHSRDQTSLVLSLNVWSGALQCAPSKVRSKVRFPDPLYGVRHLTSLCSCWWEILHC